jgi:hypothetical protein
MNETTKTTPSGKTYQNYPSYPDRYTDEGATVSTPHTSERRNYRVVQRLIEYRHVEHRHVEYRHVEYRRPRVIYVERHYDRSIAMWLTGRRFAPRRCTSTAAIWSGVTPMRASA